MRKPRGIPRPSCSPPPGTPSAPIPDRALTQGRAIERFGQIALLRALTLAARVEPTEPDVITAWARRLLIIHLKDRIGDFLCATPAVAALRMRFPHAHISLLIHRVAAEVAGANPDVDELIAYEPRGSSPLAAGRRALRAVRLFHPDAVVVLTAASFSLTALAFSVLSGSRWRVGDDAAGYGGGFPSTRGLFHAVVAHPTGVVHQVDRYLSYARLLGCPEPKRVYRLRLPDAPKTAAPGPAFIVLQPTNTPEDSWPVERWIELGKRLADQTGARLLCVAGPGQEARARAVANPLGAAVMERQPLLAVAAGLACARLFIGHDSGIAHLAAAVGAPAVTLFGLGDPVQWAPIGPNRVVVEAPGKQMDRLSVETVLSAALARLSAV